MPVFAPKNQRAVARPKDDEVEDVRILMMWWFAGLGKSQLGAAYIAGRAYDGLTRHDG